MYRGGWRQRREYTQSTCKFQNNDVIARGSPRAHFIINHFPTQCHVRYRGGRRIICAEVGPDLTRCRNMPLIDDAVFNAPPSACMNSNVAPYHLTFVHHDSPVAMSWIATSSSSPRPSTTVIRTIPHQSQHAPSSTTAIPFLQVVLHTPTSTTPTQLWPARLYAHVD